MIFDTITVTPDDVKSLRRRRTHVNTNLQCGAVWIMQVYEWRETAIDRNLCPKERTHPVRIRYAHTKNLQGTDTLYRYTPYWYPIRIRYAHTKNMQGPVSRYRPYHNSFDFRRHRTITNHTFAYSTSGFKK